MPAPRQIPPHLIERVWDIYQTHTVGNGVEPDKLQFISGVGGVMGLLLGTVDVGIPEGTLTRDVMAQLMEELGQYRAEIAHLEEQARQRTERRNR